MGEPLVILDEQRWIRAAQDGDADAFNSLVDAYQDMAYTVAVRTLGHAEDAADATQEAFISAYRSIGGFRGGLWDEHTDVEYTFYGLGTLALAALMLGN